MMSRNTADISGSKLFHAIHHGKARQISYLLDKNVDVDVRDEEGKTPLIYAVCCDIDDVRTHVVRLLLRSNCYINAQDNTGCTALMYACMEAERVDVVRLISRNKACDPNILDTDHYTAAMHAVAASNAPALKILLNSSATKSVVNLNIKNKNGLSALDLAVKLQLMDCCRVLTSDGAANASNIRDKRGLNLILGREATMTSQRGNMMLNPTLQVPGLSPRDGYNSRNATPIPEWSLQTPAFDNINIGTEHWQSRVHSSNTVSSASPWTDSPRRIKRTLTPISHEERLTYQPESPIFGNRMRLPSIPSGKRLCLVSSQNSFDIPSSDR